jgi:subtilase family protein/List-Bact-rpt repeat protein/fibronectin type III domain protein/fervidolysin-like protein/HYDIN/CFA65/VesB family protein
MRAIRLARVLLLLSVFLPDGSAMAQAPPRYDPDTILVRFKGSALAQEKALTHALMGAQAHKHFALVEGLQAVRIPKGSHVKDAIKFYRQQPAVLYAEPNWIVHTQATPNDPRFGELWGLHNTGQSGGARDADIDAPEAWDVTTGSSDVVVAVIDTGIDYTHPDLAANMFRNTLDCNNNGIDDDGNGQIDDCFGIDTANNDSDPMDDGDHGTHVAGTIGAVGDNGVGVSGVNRTVRLMPCKFLDSAGSGTVADAIDCLEYVKLMKERGVNIVATNNSWGGSEFSQALFDAIDAHGQRGILFIAAAGNDGSSNDTTPSYPAGYFLPNVISVAATTRTDAQASFSNFGRRTVHLGAPGSEILSTTRGDTYQIFSGTSMATPHVTGVAALLKAQDPERDWRAIKNLILAGGDTVSSLANTITGKRLNARGALSCLNSIVRSRLLPVGTTISGSVGTPIDLAVLHINCASPNGTVSVTVDPGGQILSLADDGLGSDQAAGDGIYSGPWTPASAGTYTLTFPGGDPVTVQVTAAGYSAAATAFEYRTITGTNLNLGDDASASITSPFPILFAGGSFSTLFVSSNGNVNFTRSFTAFSNASIPTVQVPTLMAPWWDDLLPVAGTAQNVFWAVTGTAPGRELVIEWRNVRHFGCAPNSAATVRFQVVFFEGRSSFLFNYADAVIGGSCASADAGGSATVGVQVSASLGTQWSFNTQRLGSSTSLLWALAQPPTIDVTPSSRSFGSVPVGSSEDRSFIVRNTGEGVVSGTAAASAPFLVVPGGSYSLSMGQSQRVTVRFSPRSAGTFAGNVTFSGAGGTTRSVMGTGTSVSPAAPSGLTATGASARQINLAWQDASGNETEFRLEQKTGPGGTFGQIATLGANTTGYSNTGLSPSTPYVYRVRACNAVGCSGYSNEATTTTPSDVAFTLTLAIRGSAGGTVTSAPAGIGCGSSCSASYAAGTMVTLTATPGSQASFKGWGGACSGSATTCTLAMSRAQSMTATFSMIFTDPTVSPRRTIIRAVHVTDLRSAVDTLRSLSGLPAYRWTDATLSVGSTVVRAVHVSELRAALNEAYQRLGLPSPTYTEPALAARETVPKAAHLSEVRSAVRGIE